MGGPSLGVAPAEGLLGPVEPPPHEELEVALEVLGDGGEAARWRGCFGGGSHFSNSSRWTRSIFTLSGASMFNVLPASRRRDGLKNSRIGPSEVFRT
jgi:hypothetical protein